MKKIIYILVFFLPVTCSSQQLCNKYSPIGYAWTNVGNAGFSAGEATGESLAFSPSTGQPYVAFTDLANASRATVMKFDGSNWVYVGVAGFSAGTAGGMSLAFSPSNNKPYVVYQDVWNDYKATVMMFNDTNWVNVGNAGFTPSTAGGWIKIAFSPSDSMPYVLYLDGSDGWKTTVMRFDGTNWGYVGNPGFSNGPAVFLSLAFSPFGQPYVACTVSNFGVTVMKFDGVNWVIVGNNVLTTNGIDGTSLAFSPSDYQPYVAFVDNPTNYKASVMRFNGTNWDFVGNEGFSPGSTDCISLAFSPSDSLPYIAIESPSVMKFDGTDWLFAGDEFFYPGGGDFTCLAFSPSGTPTVAFRDYGNGKKATVMKYDSVLVGINEAIGARVTIYPNPVTNSLTIDLKQVNGTIKFIEIYDVKGDKVVETQTEQNRFILNAEQFPAGIYIVKVKSAESNWVGKFSKD